MISDVLHEAIENIDYYLNEDNCQIYSHGKIRDKIVKLRNDMEALRLELDKAPEVSLYDEKA